MANYEVLEPGGHAALVDGLKDYADREGGTDTEQLADGSVEMDKLGDDVLDELDSKAYADGYYAQLTAGAADNLTGRGDATTAEFLYRTAGGTADIETGQAVAKSVKGNTLVWNQLYNSSEVSSKTINGVTFTVNADGSITASGTATEMAVITLYGIPVVAGHKYLFKGCPSSGSLSTYFSYLTGAGFPYSGHVDTGAGNINVPSTTSTASYVLARVESGQTVDNLVFRPQLFDLTQMFGAGNELSTVAEFEALFPLPYYEYDAGSLLPVNMEGIETVGFNQWDEEWESGLISGSGADTSIHSKNFCKIFPNTTYYATCGKTDGGNQNRYYLRVAFYDVNKNLISQGYYNNLTFTTPENAAYFKIETNTSTVIYGNTYKHDICINLSWSGRRNGEYEPYWSSQREIAAATYFPDGMRSAGSVYDELTATEAIQRVGVVDLGMLTWNKATDGSKQFIVSRANFPELQAWTDINLVGNIICPKYTTVKYNDASAPYGNIDKTIAVGGVTNAIAVLDSAYESATAAEFKAAMSGVMLHYALATPTVTPIDPALNLSYRVDDFGTERVMVPEDERSAPPVLDIAYGLNVVDFVRRAPSEYISHASMSQFRLALMSHLGVFINETWDEVDNRYEYTITSE